MNSLGILSLPLGESCPENQFVEANNRLQRSSKLMAHIQQEFPLGRINGRRRRIEWLTFCLIPDQLTCAKACLP